MIDMHTCTYCGNEFLPRWLLYDMLPNDVDEWSAKCPHCNKFNIVATPVKYDPFLVCWEYGRAVADRERSALSSAPNMALHNKRCHEYWELLISLNCYEDEENSTLKPEYRPYYLTGLNGGYFESVIPLERLAWELGDNTSSLRQFQQAGLGQCGMAFGLEQNIRKLTKICIARQIMDTEGAIIPDYMPYYFAGLAGESFVADNLDSGR